MCKLQFTIDTENTDEIRRVAEFLTAYAGSKGNTITKKETADTPPPVEPTATPIAPSAQTVPVQPETPAATTAPAPVSENTTDVDSTGRPWDARIDSSNRKKSANGKWQKRRGVTPELIAQVTAELMSGVGATAQPEAAPAQPVMAAAPPPPQQPAPVAPAAPSVDPTAITTLPLLVQYLEMKGLQLTDITETASACGCENIAFLGTANYAHVIPAIVAQLETQRG